tara:strand:- start:203 stop:469 length:267 start_codon:yes stop_codon:yes gene_type:complete
LSAEGTVKIECKLELIERLLLTDAFNDITSGFDLTKINLKRKTRPQIMYTKILTKTTGIKIKYNNFKVACFTISNLFTGAFDLSPAKP